MDFTAIRRSAPILEAARRLGLEVTRNRTRCFHPERHKNNDRTPSLSFNLARNSFRCWVCDEVKGSVLDLVMQIRGVKVREAALWLIAEGLAHETEGEGSLVPASRPVAVSETTVPRAMTGDGEAKATDEERRNVLSFLLGCCDGVSPEALRYLKSRRIFRKTAEKMRLKSINNYEAVSDRLADRFGVELLRKTGLFNAKGHFRFYRHVLLIPYYFEGQPLWLQARAIDPAVTPKELNLGGPIPAPYNLDGIKDSAVVYLCEGAIDTLTLIEQGYPAAGIPGARNFKPGWVALFKGKRIFSAFDADPAGRAGNERMAALFAAAGIPFSVLPIPEGHDINDLFTGKK